MNNFLPNFDPKIYNISSVIIGFALIGNFSAAEQNAIGNWFITVGQILENNSAWQQVIESRIQGGININSKEAKQGGDPFFNGYSGFKSSMSKELEDIKKCMEIIMNELKKMQ